jgi:hypothetical protein
MKKDLVPEEVYFTLTGERCEQCQYYIFIDSGYGYCRRFPPKLVRKIWPSNSARIEYPLTEWCRRSCGEFKTNKKLIKE